MSKLPWFRLYADVVDNARLRLLAFEDRWHFVAICALKCEGLLDGYSDPLFERKVALKLGLQDRDLSEVKRRLCEVGLIDDDWQPVKWDVRQHRRAETASGDSQSRHKAYVYFISDSKRESVKIGYSKNPWARLKELQVSHPQRLSVVASILTTKSAEREIHSALSSEHELGEWFRFSDKIQSLVGKIKSKELVSADAVVTYCSNYVATTIDTDTDTDTDITPKGVCASDDTPEFTKNDFEESWNAIAGECGLPAIRKMTQARCRAFKVRQREYPDIADWQRAFANLRSTKWMHGDNPKGWTADPDFFLQPKSFTKLVENAYAQAD